MKKFDPVIPWADIKREVGAARLTARILALAKEQRAFIRALEQRMAIRREDWAVNEDPRFYTRLEEGPGPLFGHLVATKTPRPKCIRAATRHDHDPRTCDICWRLAEGTHPYEGGPPR